MDPNDVNDKKQTRGLRRPFGVAGWLFSVVLCINILNGYISCIIVFTPLL